MENRSLTSNDIGLLIGNLEYFILNTYDEIPHERKIKFNDTAINAISKLKNREPNLSAPECQVISISLMLFKITIEESGIPSSDREAANYLKSTNRLLKLFDLPNY